MSTSGIREAAQVFADLQRVRLNLFAGDRQDIMLGRMLEKGEDAMKDDFSRLTSDPKIDAMAKRDAAKRKAFWKARGVKS